MNDTTIIWKYLLRTVDNEHPTVYVFCTSYALRSRDTALNKLLNEIYIVFKPLPESLIKNVAVQFLEWKRKEYMKGNVKVKSLYPLI